MWKHYTLFTQCFCKSKISSKCVGKIKLIVFIFTINIINLGCNIRDAYGFTCLLHLFLYLIFILIPVIQSLQLITFNTSFLHRRIIPFYKIIYSRHIHKYQHCTLKCHFFFNEINHKNINNVFKTSGRKHQKAFL